MSIVGDGVADDTAALRALLWNDRAGIVNRTLDLAGKTIRLTDTVTARQTGPHVQGSGVGNTSAFVSNPGAGTTWLWDGPPDRFMLEVEDSSWLTMADCQMAVRTGKTCLGAIRFHGKVAATVGTNELPLIDRCQIGPTPWGGALGTFENGIVFEGDNVNNDSAHLRDLRVSARNRGILLATTQSIWSVLENVNTWGCRVGIEANADVHVTDYTCNLNDVDLLVTGNPLVRVDQMSSEGARQMVKMTGLGGKLAVNGGRWLLGPRWKEQALPAVDVAQCGDWGRITLRDLWITNYQGTPHKVRVRGATNNNPGELRVEACTGIGLANLDVQAASTADPTGGLAVSIDSYGLRRATRLTASKRLT